MLKYALMIGDHVCNTEDVPPGTTTHPSQLDAITLLLRRGGSLDSDESIKLVSETASGFEIQKNV